MTRIVLENMRTGVGEGTVRDALSNVFKIGAKKIEDAYNLVTDYSFIAEKLCKNPKSINNIGITLFKPMRVMLFQKVRSIQEGFKVVGKPAIIEVKYDGVRAQIHKKGDVVKIFTRNLDDVSTQFPDVVRYVKESVLAKSCIIEGEMVGYNP